MTTTRRQILYKSWFAVPSHMAKVLPTLPANPLKLYLAICAECRGTSKNVELSNARIKEVSGLTDDTLPPARNSLIGSGLIEANPADKRREIYAYTILEAMTADVQPIIPAPSSDPALGWSVVEIPQEHLFRTPGTAGTDLATSPNISLPPKGEKFVSVTRPTVTEIPGYAPKAR